MDIGPVELLLVVLVVAMLFGVGKLPEIGGAVGKSIREFRKASREDDDSPAADALKPESPPLSLPAGAVCASCGTVDKAGGRFCTACGSPLQPLAGA
jgi:sec-independent protein translocase protein TatA